MSSSSSQGTSRDHHPVRSQPQHRCRRARRADGADHRAAPVADRDENPAEFPEGESGRLRDPVRRAQFSHAAAVDGQRIWRHHHRPDAVADSGRRAGQRLRRAEIRHPRPGRSGSRRGARIVARRHPHRGVERQFVDPGRHAERTEAGRRAAGLRPDGQGGRLPPDRRGLAQRLAGQARRGREDLRQRRERQDRDLVQRRALDRARHPEAAGRQYGGGGRRHPGQIAGAAGADPAIGVDQRDDGSLAVDPSGGGRRRGDAADRDRAGHPGDLPVPALGVGDLHSGAGGSDLAVRHLRGDVRAGLFRSTT